MHVNRQWAALAVPMVFDCVCVAGGAFIIASCDFAALVFSLVVGIANRGC